MSLWVSFVVSKTQGNTSIFLFLLPAGSDIEHSVTSPASCLPASCHAPHMMKMNQTSGNISVPQFDSLFYELLR